MIQYIDPSLIAAKSVAELIDDCEDMFKALASETDSTQARAFLAQLRQLVAISQELTIADAARVRTPFPSELGTRLLTLKKGEGATASMDANFNALCKIDSVTTCQMTQWVFELLQFIIDKETDAKENSGKSLLFPELNTFFLKTAMTNLLEKHKRLATAIQSSPHANSIIITKLKDSVSVVDDGSVETWETDGLSEPDTEEDDSAGSKSAGPPSPASPPLSPALAPYGDVLSHISLSPAISTADNQAPA